MTKAKLTSKSLIIAGSLLSHCVHFDGRAQTENLFLLFSGSSFSGSLLCTAVVSVLDEKYSTSELNEKRDE